MAHKGKIGGSTRLEKLTVILPQDIAIERTRVAIAKHKLNKPDCGTWIVPKKKD